LPAGLFVFKTTNSCSTLPMFVTTNLTLPFGAPCVPGKTLNSSTWTATRGFDVTAPADKAPIETAITATALIPRESFRMMHSFASCWMSRKLADEFGSGIRAFADCPCGIHADQC
jgi:hypothetical protein